MCQCVSVSMDQYRSICEFVNFNFHINIDDIIINMGQVCFVVSKGTISNRILLRRELGREISRLLGGPGKQPMQGRSKDRLDTIGDFSTLRRNSRPPRPQQGMPNEKAKAALMRSPVSNSFHFLLDGLTTSILDVSDNSPFTIRTLYAPFTPAIHPALTCFKQSLTKSHDRSEHSPDSPSLAPGTNSLDCHTAILPLESTAKVLTTHHNLLLLTTTSSSKSPRSEMTAPIPLPLHLHQHLHQHHSTPAVVSNPVWSTAPARPPTQLSVCFPGLAPLRLLGTSLTLSHALMPPQGNALQLRDFTSCYKFSHFVYARIRLANQLHQCINISHHLRLYHTPHFLLVSCWRGHCL